jgi:hypothetical protein
MTKQIAIALMTGTNFSLDLIILRVPKNTGVVG